PNPKHAKFTVSLGRPYGGLPSAVIEGIDLQSTIRRWVRAFHAALYSEPLADRSFFATYPPLPSASRNEAVVKLDPIAEVFPKFVEELKRNRLTATLDRIECRNRKCLYECVWTRADNGAWLCVYCLDLYGWIRLGDTRNFTPRGCVGCYMRPEGGIPKAA